MKGNIKFSLKKRIYYKIFFIFFFSPVEERDNSSESENSDESSEMKLDSSEESAESDENAAMTAENLTQDPYMELLVEYHNINIKIMQLEEWKLRHELLESIGLPPGYKPP